MSLLEIQLYYVCTTTDFLENCKHKI